MNGWGSGFFVNSDSSRAQKVTALRHIPDVNDMVYLKELIEAGKVVPVIDRRYPLSEVADAMRYLEEGHFQGKVVITMEHNIK